MKGLFVACIAAAAFCGAPALAADMAVKAPPAVAAAPGTNWSGFYAGVNGGYAQQDPASSISGDSDGGAGSIFVNIAHNVVTVPPGLNDLTYQLGNKLSGALGGLQFGYNWQPARKWIVGLEADFDLSDLKGSASVSDPPGGVVVTQLSNQQLEWFGTLRGRLGYLVSDQLLVFGTGGLAYGETKASASMAIGGIGILVAGGPTSLNCAANTTCLAASQSRLSAGWAAGGGAEYAISKNFTLRVEYLRIDLGAQNLTLVAIPPTAGNGFALAKFNNAYDVVRGGVSYRF
jgi:outer membrane immunogenic protein